ncbi:hypothetical protein RW64_19715 [Geobacter sulfurreducens]|nr:hypothetical protein RW64_19715 [Geobacter sulfurreducens]
MKAVDYYFLIAVSDIQVNIDIFAIHDISGLIIVYDCMRKVSVLFFLVVMVVLLIGSMVFIIELQKAFFNFFWPPSKIVTRPVKCISRLLKNYFFLIQ